MYVTYSRDNYNMNGVHERVSSGRAITFITIYVSPIVPGLYPECFAYFVKDQFFSDGFVWKHSKNT